MIGGIVTLAFVVLMLLVGGLLFDTNDWGKPVKPYSGIVHGKYLAPGAKMPDLHRLCAESGYSRGYLLAAYKSAFHETMGKTLLNSRITHALELLRNSDLPVYRICQMCGFPDTANFYRVFRRETGHSPAEIRLMS